MGKIFHKDHYFELVESVPKGFQIWRIGHYMLDGYLPLVEDHPSGYGINTETMKAIKIEQAQDILSAMYYGCYTVEAMEYFLELCDSDEARPFQRRQVELIKKALPALKSIKWD